MLAFTDGCLTDITCSFVYVNVILLRLLHPTRPFSIFLPAHSLLLTRPNTCRLSYNHLDAISHHCQARPLSAVGDIQSWHCLILGFPAAGLLL